VVGADFSLEMMRVGQRKTASTWMGWVGADTLKLPFPNQYFDAVTSGFLMRNVIDVRGAFGEQCRVVRPGGRVVCLEISRPVGSPFTPFFRLYFHRIVPLLGRIISGHGEAYRYLPNSAEEFLTPEELQAEMESAGLRQVHYRRLMLGTLAIHVGVRE
jgi:demethylmenaquinone methyltransferase/2-methoxy-6-polyprenyl-1,4-benzoquinol methylase